MELVNSHIFCLVAKVLLTFFIFRWLLFVQLIKLCLSYKDGTGPCRVSLSSEVARDLFYAQPLMQWTINAYQHVLGKVDFLAFL